MRDHGGDLDRARARHGGADWLDLSTGINPVPYPVPDLPADCWARLPDATAIATLEDAARAAYGTGTGAQAVALAGAQAAIQLVPRLAAPGRARIVGPTYNEHAGALAAQGWDVTQVPDLPDVARADIAVVVNPNNPDGRHWPPQAVLDLAGTVGLLVVDESFADPHPEHALGPLLAGREGIVVLRSFGKFYGLAGVRLGFALCAPALADRLRALAGPWAVSGPAVRIGARALADTAWAAHTRARLAADAARLDRIAAAAGWRIVGGTDLFRSFAVDSAPAWQDHLARHRIWTRVFPYSDTWIRLGLPGTEAGWNRLEAALAPSARG